MGRLAEIIKDKIEQVKENREHRQRIEANANRLAKQAYDESYTKSRITTARKAGKKAGKQKKGFSGALSTLARYGASFSKASEETFGLDIFGQKSKKQTKDPFGLGSVDLGFKQPKKQKSQQVTVVKIYTGQKKRK